MSKAKKGDSVKVNYTGKLDDGTVFDSSEICGCEDDDCETGPLEFTIGEEDVFPELEQAVIGMAPGDTKTVKIPAETAYGNFDENLVVKVDRKEFPADINPEVGQILEMTDEEGRDFPVAVMDITENIVTLDANHPLSGRDLFFEIELVEIG